MVPTKTVLVVDDEPDVLTLLCMSVSSEGYDVISTTNGTEAIELALAHHPDLILLDIAMPDLDGTEVLGVLKATEATRDIPVIMITAFTERDFVMESIIDGAYAYLAKPYAHETLSDLLKRALLDSERQAGSRVVDVA